MTSMTIRMGAAHWDATIHATNTRFNFREMNTDQRKRWYRAFMDSVRTLYGNGTEKPPRRSRARRRGPRRVTR